MKYIAIALFVVIAGAFAQHPATVHQHDDLHAEVLRSESAVNPESFQYSYETSNGIKGQEQGQLKQIGTESAIVAQGDFSYTDQAGGKIEVTYVADENGYQPQGAHLPTPPPIPDQIQRALEWIRTHPQTEENLKYNNVNLNLKRN